MGILNKTYSSLLLYTYTRGKIKFSLIIVKKCYTFKNALSPTHDYT